MFQFVFLLSLVIRRLATLISTQAQLLAENAAALQQARSATTTARNMMVGKGEEAQNNSNEASAHLKEQLKEKEDLVQTLRDDVNNKSKEIKELKSELNTIKKVRFYLHTLFLSLLTLLIMYISFLGASARL